MKKLIIVIIILGILLVGFILINTKTDLFESNPEYKEGIISASEEKSINNKVHTFVDSSKDTSTFNIINDKGLKIIGNDSKNGLYSVTLKGFTENRQGKITNFTLENFMIPYWKINNNTYEYNLTIPSFNNLPQNLKYIGLYFETTGELSITPNHYNQEEEILNEISFCSENSCINLYFDKMYDEYTQQNLSYNLTNNSIKIDITGLTSLNIDPTVRFGIGNAVESMSLTPLSNNTFAMAWCDETADDIHLQMFNTTGENFTGIIDVDDSVVCAFINLVSVSAFTSDTFVIGWYDYSDLDITFSVYYSNGTLITGPIDAELNAQGASSIGVSVSAFTSDTFVIGWQDQVTDNDATFSIYYSNGTNITGQIDVDTSTFEGSISVSALNSTAFVIGWYDGTDDDVSFRVYNNITALTGIIDADTDAGINYVAVSVSALNSTAFVIGWNDGTDQDTTFTIYDINGNLLVGPIDADDATGNLGRSVTTSRLNSTSFVISWFDEDDDDQTFSIYDINSNLLVGPIDSTTSASTTMYWETLSSSNLATNIGFCNNSFIHAFAVNTTWASWISYQSNGTVWDGNCGGAEPPGDTCTYSSGNWEIDMSDYCIITTNYNLGNNNITFTGSGNVTFSNCNITNIDKIGSLGANNKMFLSKARIIFG